MIETRVNLNRYCTHKLIDEQANSVLSKNNLFTLLCFSKIKIILFYELRRRRKLFQSTTRVAELYMCKYIGGRNLLLLIFRVAEYIVYISLDILAQYILYISLVLFTCTIYYIYILQYLCSIYIIYIYISCMYSCIYIYFHSACIYVYIYISACIHAYIFPHACIHAYIIYIFRMHIYYIQTLIQLFSVSVTI